MLGTIYIAGMKTERSQSRLQPVVSREQGGETPPRDLWHMEQHKQETAEQGIREESPCFYFYLP